MTVYELIQKLAAFPANTPVEVIVENCAEEFSISWGGAEGCTKETADVVGLWVSRLNISEKITASRSEGTVRHGTQNQL